MQRILPGCRLFSTMLFYLRYIFATIAALLLLTLHCQAQKQASVWFFGGAAGIDFRSGQPVAITGGLSSNEACASICDENGELQFYTNGQTAWNRDHQVMNISLGGNHSAAQGAVIVPLPGSDDRYLIYALDGYARGLFVSEMDMSLNGGLGDFTYAAKPVIQDVNESMAAVKHCNGKDVWVVTHEKNTNRFYSFLVTSKGPELSPVVSSAGIAAFGIFGYMKISPAGTSLAVSLNNGARYGLVIFEFDPSTGKVGREKMFLADMPSYGFDFSPDGKLIYLTGSTGIIQYDLTAGDSTAIANSRYYIPAAGTTFGGMQLAPDGKIYNAYVKDKMGVIHYPNRKGAACQYEYDGFNLKGAQAIFGLPNFITNYFYPTKWNIEVKDHCPGQAINFGIQGTDPPDSVIWDFGDPASGTANTSRLMEPQHLFSEPGKYKVKLTVIHKCAVAVMDAVVEVMGSEPDLLPADTTLCPGIAFTLKPDLKDATYTWQDGSRKDSLTVTKAGTYWVEATNSCGTFRDTIMVDYLPETLDLGPDTTVCKGETVELDAGEADAYLWNNGSSQRTLLAHKAGDYYVTTTVNGCYESDTITISNYPSVWTALGKEYFICEMLDELVTLDAGKGFVEYLWFPTGDTTQWIRVSATGQYYVIVDDFRGCTGSDSTTVKRRCPAVVYMPNAFSPNGDGLNEIFGPVAEDVSSFSMVIYNRWGERVFETGSIEKGWDGSFKTSEAPEGTYLWMATYTGYDHNKEYRQHHITGQVNLLR